MGNFHLSNDRDRIEKLFWPAINDGFPNYERFWQQLVVPMILSNYSILTATRFFCKSITCCSGKPGDGQRGQETLRQDSISTILCLQVLWLQSRFLGNLPEKSGAYFFVVVEGECVVRPISSLQAAMGAFLPSDLPSDPKQSGKQLSCLDGFPVAHATEKTLVNGSGIASP